MNFIGCPLEVVPFVVTNRQETKCAGRVRVPCRFLPVPGSRLLAKQKAAFRMGHWFAEGCPNLCPRPRVERHSPAYWALWLPRRQRAMPAHRLRFRPRVAWF